MTTPHTPTLLVADEKVYCHIGRTPNGRNWIAKIYGLDGDGHIFAEAYGFLEEEARANAALVVKAVESYEALVKALLETRQTLNQALGVIVEFGNLNGVRNLSDQEFGKSLQTMAESAAQQIENADAALALAGVRVMECEVCQGLGDYPIYNKFGKHIYSIDCPECLGLGVTDFDENQKNAPHKQEE